MNLDELRTVQSKERSKDSLQHLRESFYVDVADYVADLKAQREHAAERADSPFDDPEVNRLTDEINTAEDVVEAIYERRVGKIVKRASLAAAGMPADEEGLTSEEQELFTELVERIEANKEQVLDVLAGEATETTTDPSAPEASAAEASPTADAAPTSDAAPEPGDPPAPGVDEPSGAGAEADTDASGSVPADADVSAADVMGGTDAAANSASGSASADSTASAGGRDADGTRRPTTEAEAPAVADRPNDEPAAESTTASVDDSATAPGDAAAAESDADPDDPLAGLDERTTVRVTDDVGEIFGVDERTYELASEDVVTLPEANAAPLVERGAAERLE